MSGFDKASDAYFTGHYLQFLEIVVEGNLAKDKKLRELLPMGFDVSILESRSGVSSSLMMEFAAELWDRDELRGIAALKEAAGRGSVEAVGAVGRALLWMGDAASAREWLERALEAENCDSPHIRGDLGEALWALSAEDAPRIEGLLQSGMSASSHYGITLSKLLDEQGRFEEERLLLEELVHSDEYGAAIRLGNLLDAQFGDASAAEGAYSKGIESGDGFSAFNLAILRRKKGDPDGAAYYRTVARSLGDLSSWPDEDIPAG